MNDNRLMHEHEQVDLLLPWYVNDTLDPAEHDRVAMHVATCPQCQESIVLLDEVQAAVVRNKATPIVPRPRVNELLESINTSSPLRRLGSRQSNTYLAAAAVTLLLLATLLIINPDTPQGEPAEFETATSSQAGTSMDYVLTIQFGEQISEAERNRVLQDIGARDISGGSAEGSYRVIVQLSAASLEELNRYTNSVESLPEVASVEVVALQLPVKTDK